jgi:hypothetical protein
VEILRDQVLKDLFAVYKFQYVPQTQENLVFEAIYSLLYKYEREASIIRLVQGSAIYLRDPTQADRELFFEVQRKEENPDRAFLWNKVARLFATTEEELVKLLDEKIDKQKYLV